MRVRQRAFLTGVLCDRLGELVDAESELHVLDNAAAILVNLVVALLFWQPIGGMVS